MPKTSRTACRLFICILSLGILCAAPALGKEITAKKGFEFNKTKTFMKEMETRPDFPVGMVLANDYVYSLLVLGDTITLARKSSIISFIKNAQQKDGGFVSDKVSKTSSLLYTDLAMETLGYLNSTNAVDTARLKSFIISLKNSDGGFGFSGASKQSSLATTFYAIHVLKMVGGIDVVDKSKTAQYIKRFELKDGGFNHVGGTGTSNAKNSYMAVAALNCIGMLDDTTRKNVVKFLATTPYLNKKSKETPVLDEQLYTILALKELKATGRIDKQLVLAFMKKLYIKMNGGFGPLEGYGSTPDSTTAALRILAETGVLKPPATAPLSK